MSKTEKIKFSEEERRKANSKAHRDALISENLYSVPTHKVHKNKKAYSRKGKHKKDYLSEL